VGKSIACSPAPHPFEDECCWPGCEVVPHPELPLCGEHIAEVVVVAGDAVTALLAAPSAPAPRRPQADPVIYYVQIAPDVIKIGTTGNLRKRLMALRVEPGAVLVTEPGGEPLERMRHAQFKHLRLGRWENFRAEPDLLSHVEMLRAHTAC
jgi:hypothetical protein